MSKYQWRRGVVQETLPSTLNWWGSLGILILIYLSLASTIDRGDALYIYERVSRNEFFLFGMSFWFCFRGSLTGFRFWTALKYLFFVFPKMRRELEMFAPYGTVAILYTGYAKSETEVFNALVAVYKAAYRYGSKRTILVMAMSKNEKGEHEFPLLEEVRKYMVGLASSQEEVDFYHGMILRAFAQDGTGKRSALVRSIRFIRDELGGADVYYMMDGDSIPAEDAFVRSIPFFQNHPDIGGLTLENRVYTQGGEFYNLYSLLRFVRRRVDLAYAATVLTGRGSFIRGCILESDEALTLLGSHFISWGSENIIKALTGDDKTMVYLTWSQRYRTLFIPDVHLYAMEEALPEAGPKGLVKGLKQLGLHEFFAAFLSMLVQETRYTRNMQLVGKALWQVRPADLPITMKLLDQRFFFWSAVVGPISAIVASIMYHPVIFLFWVFTSLNLRIVVTLFQGLVYGYWHPMMPFISFLNVAQGIVKIFSYHNIDKARWNRDGGEEVSYNWWLPVLYISAIAIVITLILNIGGK